MYLIGFDIGTSSIKASIVDAHNGSVRGTTSYPETEMSITSNHPGWAEQEPELWWENLCKASKKLLSKTGINPADIKAIGITYQMHGLVLIDKYLRILRPAIIWCDSRAAEIGDNAFNQLGQEFCLNNYLNSPGNFTASKLKWVKTHEPHIYNKTRKVLLPGDFINMKFTHELNTTISGLSEGIMWNFRTGKIADRLLDHYGIDTKLLPETIDTLSESGRITIKAAEETGLTVGTPVTYRAGDQPNNAMSLNVLQKGEVAATCGTSGVVYGVTDNSAVDRESRVNGFAHVNYKPGSDNIGMLLCINGAGIGYSWLKKQVAHNKSTFDQMEKEATMIPVGSERLITLPFGNGAERIFNNKDIGAHMLNLNFNQHRRAHMYRSLLEGVAFSFVYGMNIMKTLGLNLDTIKVSNDNMFKSVVFASTISTLMNTNIEITNTTGAVGAAKAAGVSIKMFDSLRQAFTINQPVKVIAPSDSPIEYLEAYSNWEKTLNKFIQK